MYLPFLKVFTLLLTLLLLDHKTPAEQIEPDRGLIHALTTTDGLVALWKFDEPAGQARKAIGEGSFPLREGSGQVERVSEGPVSGYAIRLDGNNYLRLPHAQTRALNLHGDGQGITVMAWVRWSGEQTGFVGGMWNEHTDGGRRQYGLFISLPHYNGKDQVCGHISRSGKPTPPFPYSIDHSASRQKVPADTWTCIVFTYDGEYIRSYVDGSFEARKPELIRHTEGFPGYPEGLVQSKNPYHFPDGMGDNGSDFTVGAVQLKDGMGNFYKGLIGGLAVFDRALSDEEIKRLAE